MPGLESACMYLNENSNPFMVCKVCMLGCQSSFAATLSLINNSNTVDKMFPKAHIDSE